MIVTLFSSFVKKLALFLGLVTFLIAGWLIADLIYFRPIAPWFDELWNLYPSLLFLGIDNKVWVGCSNGLCVHLFGYTIPILSGPYHGLIKSLVFAPLVLLGNLSLIRLFNLIIFFSPLLYLFFQRTYFGKKGIFLLIATYYLLFPTLLVEATFDQGQFIFANSFLFIALLELIKFLQTQAPKNAGIALILSGLAVYEKLTNVPVGIAICLVAGLFLLYRKSYFWLCISLGCGLIFLTPYLFFIWKNPSLFAGMTDIPHEGYGVNLNTVLLGSYAAIFLNSITLNGFLGKSYPVLIPLLGVGIFVLTWGFMGQQLLFTLFARLAKLPISISPAAPSRQAKTAWQAWAVLFLPLLALLIFPIFDGINRPWHLYQLAPLLCVPIAYLSLQNPKTLSAPKKLWGMIENYVLGLILLAALVNTVSLVFPAWRQERVHPYDPSLFLTAQAIRSLPGPKQLVCIDYSICGNLIFLLGPQYKALADWAHVPSDKICQHLMRLEHEDYLFISRIDHPNPLASEMERLMRGNSQFFEDHCAHGFEKVNPPLASEGLPNYLIYRHLPK